MKYYVEQSLRNFDFWGPARDLVRNLTDRELDIIEFELECDGREWSETEINDLFSYDQDYIHELLGHDKCEIVPEDGRWRIYVNDEPEEDGELYDTREKANEYANENYIWIV